MRARNIVSAPLVARWLLVRIVPGGDFPPLPLRNSGVNRQVQLASFVHERGRPKNKT
jgi:hypothetical protein